MSQRALFDDPKNVYFRLVLFISWFSFLIVGCMYWYHIYFVMTYMTEFPAGFLFMTLMWLLHISFRIPVMLLPLATMLTYWENKNKRIIVAYHGICIFGIILNLLIYIILFITFSYRDDYVRNEWISSTQRYIDLHERLPPWSNIISQMEDEDIDCCGWHNPADFGTLIKIDKFYSDPEFILQIAGCAADTFHVFNDNGNLIYQGGYDTPMPLGCAVYFKRNVREKCYYIAFMALLLILVEGFYSFAYYLSIQEISIRKRNVILDERDNLIRALIRHHGDGDRPENEVVLDDPKQDNNINTGISYQDMPSRSAQSLIESRENSKEWMNAESNGSFEVDDVQRSASEIFQSTASSRIFKRPSMQEGESEDKIPEHGRKKRKSRSNAGSIDINYNQDQNDESHFNKVKKRESFPEDKIEPKKKRRKSSTGSHGRKLSTSRNKISRDNLN